MTDKENKAISISNEDKKKLVEEYLKNKREFTIDLEFDGDPIAYSRPRYRSIPGKSFGFFYNPKSKIEHALRKQLEDKVADSKELQSLLKNTGSDYYVELDFEFYMPVLKSETLKNIYLQEAKIMLPNNKRHKDIDNLIKPWLDIFNEALYDDDKRVMTVKADKFYSVNPRVEIKAKYTIL